MKTLDKFNIKTWDNGEFDEFHQMYFDTFYLVKELMRIDGGEDPRDWAFELIALERMRIYGIARFGDEWSKVDIGVPNPEGYEDLENIHELIRQELCLLSHSSVESPE